MRDSGANSRAVKALWYGVALVALTAGVEAHARDAADQATDPAAATNSVEAGEIIVTGTYIRGIAPAGTNVIGVNQATVEESGAASTAQLLQTIPQLGFFNNLQVPTGASNVVTTNRPNLRNLPGFNTSGASPTLVLVDGHRVVGMGITTTSPDADIVPPGAIERVEIVPDGGSAVYGSDAVAGVINFITRKKYDGLEVGGHFGLAHAYNAWDVNATLGHSWNTGSIYIAYNYAQHDQLLGSDLGYVFQPQTTIDGIKATSFKCSPGNVTVGNAFLPAGTPTTTYALSPTGARLAAGTTNQCDDSDGVTIYPRERRHSVMAGLRQELTDTLTFDTRVFYTNRLDLSQGGPNIEAVNFGPSFLAQYGYLQSPLFSANKVATGFLGAGETQTVYYQVGGAGARPISTRLTTWGVAPGFTLKLPGDMQLRSTTSYSESSTQFHSVALDNATSVANAAITAGLLNPYNPSASDPTALAVAQNLELFGHTRQRQFNSRLVLDGSLFQLPGGAVKIAAGGEYDSENFIARNGGIIPGTENTGSPGVVVGGATLVKPYGALVAIPFHRSITSAFGELVVPVVGKDNGLPLIRELTLSAAGRYDHYSDFGGTFNPKFGITWRPFDWVKLRGSYGKSFVAPSLADLPAASQTSVTFINLPFLLPAANLVGTTVNGVTVPAIGGRSQAIVLGSAPGIQPQRAKTLSLGMDLDPPFVPGLHLSGTYYKIIYSGAIQLPNFTSSTFYPNFIGTPAITFNPTQAQIDGVLGLAGGGGGLSTVQGTSCGGNTPGGPAGASGGCYVLIDARKTNLANFNLSGLDMAAYFTHQTGFGSVDVAFNGTYELTRNQQATPTSPYIGQLGTNFSRFKFRSTVGAQIGALRAQATLNHNSGYQLGTTAGVSTQTAVAAYNTVDLFFKLDLKGKGALQGVSLTLNVNNALNQDPPVYLLQSITPQADGYANGGTIGRYIQFGINKKF
ncbi:MAG: TonB-dependent receptor [Sphingomonadales bacterium]|nr:TonB-dependent receptor [Sphingomonadales bacterium]